MPSFTIHINEVTNFYKTLNLTLKSPGPDGIPAFLLKEAAAQLAPSLTQIFQASLNQQKLPSGKMYMLSQSSKKETELPQKLQTHIPVLQAPRTHHTIKHIYAFDKLSSSSR